MINILFLNFFNINLNINSENDFKMKLIYKENIFIVYIFYFFNLILNYSFKINYFINNLFLIIILKKFHLYTYFILLILH